VGFSGGDFGTPSCGTVIEVGFSGGSVEGTPRVSSGEGVGVRG